MSNMKPLESQKNGSVIQLLLIFLVVLCLLIVLPNTYVFAQDINEEALKSLLTAKTSQPILAFNFGDYDNDGVKEAFAFVGNKNDDPDEESFIGELWFVNKDGARIILDETVYWNINETYRFGNYKFIVLSRYYTTAGIELIWGVKSGRPYEVDISRHGERFEQIDNLNLTMTDITFDACTDGTGRTNKLHYFYWDEALKKFKEYGGIKITEEQLLKCSGARDIIDSINDTGAKIGGIFYRANNIININYSDREFNSNATLILDNGAVELKDVNGGQGTNLQKSNQEGVYREAMIPQVALYPNSFPVVDANIAFIDIILFASLSALALCLLYALFLVARKCKKAKNMAQYH